MDNGFKFEIGQRVRLRLNQAIHGMVLERVINECSSGIERRYKLRLTDAGLHVNWFPIPHAINLASLDLLSEIELETVPDAPPRSALEILRDAKEAAVAETNFQLTAAIRDVIEKHKK